MGLPLPEAGIAQTVFPSVSFTCTTGTLSSCTLCNRFGLADPLVLTNQVAFAKCVFQCLNVPVAIAFSGVFNSALYHSIFPRSWCTRGDMIYPLNAMLFGPGVYGVVSEMSPVVWFSSHWDAMSPWDLLFKAQNSATGAFMEHRICFQTSSSSFHHCKPSHLLWWVCGSTI